MIKRKLLIPLMLFILTGCAVTSEMTPVLIESVRPAPAGIVEQHKEVSRSKLDQALEASRGSSNVRVVPLITSAAQAPATPEYRVFNVLPNGIGELIGLKNADVLVSAHGYVIQSPIQFYKYLQVLRGQNGAWVEIRREGKPMLLKMTVAN